MPTNLELVRSTYTLGPPALFAAPAPDVEWTEAAGFPYAGTYRGVDEIMNGVFARIGAEWDGFGVDMDNLYDAGDNVIATGFYHGTYRSTNRSMRASFAHVITLKDEKLYVSSSMWIA